MKITSRLAFAAVWLAGFATIQASSCWGIDPSSLIAVKESSTSVTLNWEDLTPTLFCVSRDETPIITTVIGSTDIVTYTDDMAIERLLYYQVDEPLSGLCSGDCASDADCAPSDYCEHPTGACSDLGSCVAVPSSCGPDDPVCGCDGITYRNACEAARARVSVERAGSCTVGGCASNADCAATDFCDKAVGDCLGVGACAPRPAICTGIYDPVCGCDGVTYGNSCNAASAGMPIEYLGEC
jgi:hypothetical protein